MMDAELLFEEQARNINKQFPDLTLEIKEEGPEVVGAIVLRHENGDEIDRYQVRITPSGNFPFRFPKVFETGGRIPRKIEWHVFPLTGNCCIASEPAEIQTCRKGLSLSEFIESHLYPYFFNQKHRELNGYFKDECAHNYLVATIEYFQDLLRTDSLRVIIAALSLAQKETLPSRTSVCFCNSGKKYRKCHREEFLMLKKYIPDKEYLNSVVQLLKGIH